MSIILTEDFSGRMNPYIHSKNIKNINSMYERKGINSVEKNLKKICEKFSKQNQKTIKLNITDGQ